MKLRISAAIFALALAAPFAFAQAMKIGSDVASPDGVDLARSSVRTLQ